MVCYYSYGVQNSHNRQEGGGDLGKDVVNEFLAIYPEYSNRELFADSSGTVIKTKGGRVLAILGNDGEWNIKGLGGRPTESPKSRSLKVRLTEGQYNKVATVADSEGITKGDVVRNLIDDM